MLQQQLLHLLHCILQLALTLLHVWQLNLQACPWAAVDHLMAYAAVQAAAAPTGDGVPAVIVAVALAVSHLWLTVQQQQQPAVVGYVLAQMAGGNITTALLQRGVLLTQLPAANYHEAARIMAAVLRTQPVPADAAPVLPTDPAQPEHVAAAAVAANIMPEGVCGLGLALLLCLSPWHMLTFRQMHPIPHRLQVALNAVAPVLVLLVVFVLCELQQGPPADAAAAAAAPVNPEAVLQAAIERLVRVAVQQDPPQPQQ